MTISVNKKHQKDTKAKNKSKRIPMLILIPTCCSILCAVFLIVTLLLLANDVRMYYPFASVTVNGFNDMSKLYLTILIAFAGYAFAYLFNKENKKELSKKFFIFLSLLTIYCIPLAVSAFGVNIVDNYTAEYEASKELKNETDNNVEILNEGDIKFNIIFSDFLFKNYDYKELSSGKNELIASITEACMSEIEDFNISSDIRSYDSIIIEVYDSEFTYMFYCDENLYIKDSRKERINKLNESIDLRVNADSFYHTSENQMLIALRYIDLANEYYTLMNYDNSVDYYGDSISWNLTALQTMFNEDTTNNQEQLLDNIIKAYEHINTIYSEDNRYDALEKKTDILIEVYKSIKNSL